VPSNWREYFDILRHKHTARLAISAAERIIASAKIPAESDLSEVVQKALVSVAADAESKGRIETAAEVAMSRLSVYEDMVKNKGKLIGVPSGIKTLDSTTGGFRNGQVIVIGAPTKGGKTALALNMAMRAAGNGFPVGIISLEMSSGELLDRLVASLSGANVAELSSEPTKALMDKIRWGIGQVSRLPIFIRDESSINPLQLRAAARRMVAAHGVKMLVIDYIQLIEPLNRKESREQQVAESSRTIKILAKELGVPIIALTQPTPMDSPESPEALRTTATCSSRSRGTRKIFPIGGSILPCQEPLQLERSPCHSGRNTFGLMRGNNPQQTNTHA
jgi:replicative DNA helicase